MDVYKNIRIYIATAIVLYRDQNSKFVSASCIYLCVAVFHSTIHVDCTYLAAVTPQLGGSLA